MELCRGKLAGLPESPPIDDFTFATNGNKVIRPIEAHDGMGAKRKPDIVCVSQPAAEALKSDTINWTDIYAVMELKFRLCTLVQLNEERVKRGLKEYDTRGRLKVRKT